jgi:hypothetical protein
MRRGLTTVADNIREGPGFVHQAFLPGSDRHNTAEVAPFATRSHTDSDPRLLTGESGVGGQEGYSQVTQNLGIFGKINRTDLPPFG